MPTLKEISDIHSFLIELLNLLHVEVPRAIGRFRPDIGEPLHTKYEHALHEATQQTERWLELLDDQKSLSAYRRQRLNMAGLHGVQLEFKLGMFGFELNRVRESLRNNTPDLPGSLVSALGMGSTLLDSIKSAVPGLEPLLEIVNIAKEAIGAANV